jgi:hypothetical protein
VHCHRSSTCWRWTRIFVGFGLAVAAVLGQAYTILLLTSASGDPLCLNALKTGPLFPVCYSLAPLHRDESGQSFALGPRHEGSGAGKQLVTLPAPTVVAGLTDPLAIAGSLNRGLSRLNNSSIQT